MFFVGFGVEDRFLKKIWCCSLFKVALLLILKSIEKMVTCEMKRKRI